MAGLQALPASTIHLPSRISALLPDHSPEHEIEVVLASVDTYIIALTRRMAHSLSFIKPSHIELEIDEIIQRVRIKLWWELQKRKITHLKAYIKVLVRSEYLDLCRQQRLAPSLNSDDTRDELELASVATGEEMQAPANELEQQEISADIISEIVQIICKLPARQRYAMLCSLKDYIDNAPRLIEALSRPCTRAIACA